VEQPRGHKELFIFTIVGVFFILLVITLLILLNSGTVTPQNSNININQNVNLNANNNTNLNANTNINSNSKERDAKRVSDIRQIQSILELFYNDQITPSYPADGVAGARGTSDIGALLSSVGKNIPIASNPPETGCSNPQNIYIYTSYTDAVHHTDCDQQPCSYYTLSYCLGNDTGRIEKGPHTACERGIDCKPEDNIYNNLNTNLNLNTNSNENTNLNLNLNTNTGVTDPLASLDCSEEQTGNYRRDLFGYYNDEDDAVCCNDSADCVFEGLCYGLCVPGEPPCSMADIDGDRVKGHYCMNDGSGIWRDCDEGKSLCTKVSYCDFDNAWALSGEQEDHGNYDADFGLEMCCGDDAGEYLIEKNGNYICCNSPDDTLNNYYNCQSSNATN